MTNKLDSENQPYTRSFNQIELEQMKELKNFMSTAFDAKTWNFLRDEAKQIWVEKIISAVDGLRKWSISYDKSSKQVKFVGVQF